ncbi:MAG: hypothetical protein M3139_00925 [Bacteroidota bacterium]|nr:hypothetical protein [Bacteroidota bacterium]
MKTTFKLIALCLLLCGTYVSKAQATTSSRPDLFNSYSAVIPASVSELDKAFTKGKTTSIQLNFSDKLSFTSTVLSSIKRYDNLSSVIIKSTLLQNSILSISKRINDDNTITYVGRIINEKYADGYVLEQDKSGNYSFNKIRTADLIQDY